MPDQDDRDRLRERITLALREHNLPTPRPPNYAITLALEERDLQLILRCFEDSIHLDRVGRERDAILERLDQLQTQINRTKRSPAKLLGVLRDFELTTNRKTQALERNGWGHLPLREILVFSQSEAFATAIPIELTPGRSHAQIALRSREGQVVGPGVGRQSHDPRCAVLRSRCGNVAALPLLHPVRSTYPTVRRMR